MTERTDARKLRSMLEDLRDEIMQGVHGEGDSSRPNMEDADTLRNVAAALERVEALGKTPMAPYFSANSIGAIIADGYDTDHDTMTIADAVYDHVKYGDCNPFKAEADKLHGVAAPAGNQGGSYGE